MSINEFLEIIVESKTALSIVVFEPILQLSSIKTLPTWFILTLDFGSNPKPVPPITTPDLITQSDPIIQSCIVELEYMIEFVPIVTFGPIVQFDWIITFLPILQFSPMSTNRSICRYWWKL